MSAADTSKLPLDFDAIRAAVTGQWDGVLAAIGIDVLRNRHQPCPGCGGRDRFRYDDKDGRGTWICGQGGGEPIAGDGFALIQHVRGCGVAEAFEAVAGVLGEGSLRKPLQTPQRRPESPSVGKRSYALENWLKCDREDVSVAAHGYVQSKGFHAAHGCGVVDGVRSREWDGEKHCLLVPIRSHGTGKVIAVQAITPEGQKVTFGSMTAEDGTPGYLLLGNDLDPDCRIFVAEGWADVVSLVFLAYEGNACGAVAFGKGRLEKVAQQVYADLGRLPVIVEDGA